MSKGYTPEDSSLIRTIVWNKNVSNKVPINERTIIHEEDNLGHGFKKGDEEVINDGYEYILKPEHQNPGVIREEGYPETIGEVLDSGTYQAFEINALGEGGINVCSEGGDIEIGDYICSSNIQGKGMKQIDDILHNYTVAKALEDVVWENETHTTKMIACTYHCG